MTKILQVYRCNVCGNITELVHVGVGELVCCGEPMEPLREQKEDEGFEKHVPVIESQGQKTKVKIGSTPHPMEEKHYIEWVEYGVGEQSCRKFLKPGVVPETDFCSEKGKDYARIYCNVHGLWRS